MNKPTNRSTEGMLLTIQQAAEVSNLGVATTRRIAEEAGAIRRIGRCVRVNPKVFLDYIESVYLDLWKN